MRKVLLASVFVFLTSNVFAQVPTTIVPAPAANLNNNQPQASTANNPEAQATFNIKPVQGYGLNTTGYGNNVRGYGNRVKGVRTLVTGYGATTSGVGPKVFRPTLVCPTVDSCK